MTDAAPPPLWTLAPFAVYLLLIALIPALHGQFWERNRNKLLVAVLASAPVLGYLALAQPGGLDWLADSMREYAAFMTMLLALYTITGGIRLRGAFAATTTVNTAFLAAGAIGANLVGTIGASLLLIRPLLRANEGRARRAHVVVFFIFVVSNCGGLLTPLGDPPLFLGFLRGVPFFWTLRLFAPWAFVNGALLLIFAAVDRWMRARERRADASPLAGGTEPLRIEGGLNFLWLAGVVAAIYVAGAHGDWLGANAHARALAQIAALLAFAGLSLRLTPKAIHAANHFTWTPIVEVAVVFLGVFVTMVPALRVLAARGAELGVTRPWQFFWASGALSSSLDNAPTYLAFTTLATGVVNQMGGAQLTPDRLGGLAAHPTGAALLAAVSCGAVFMGALTYIGNGPNFMVRALAEQHGVRMPGFFGYVLWSCAVLVPLFGAVTMIFFWPF